MADIIFDFQKGTLKSDLAELPEFLLDGAEEAVNQIADLMVGLAQVHVLVDTGSLRDSIRKERGGKSKNWCQVRVRAGGYVVNPRTGKIVDYAVYVEQKYPYMKPAWDEVRPEAERYIRELCLERIKRMRSTI